MHNSISAHATILCIFVLSCGGGSSASRSAESLPPLPSGLVGSPCNDNPECPGVSHRCICDEGGNIVLSDSDRNGDGRIETRTTYSYDAQGVLLVSEMDIALDGNINRQQVWRYDDGQLQAYETDRDGDGVVDTWVDYETDEAGLVVQEDYYHNADDTIDERVLLSYDDEGNRITRDVDLSADGTIDRNCHYDPPCPPPYTFEVCSDRLYCGELFESYPCPEHPVCADSEQLNWCQCDRHDRIFVAEVHVGERVEQRRIYFYASRDRLERMEVDTEGDGTPDWECVFVPPCDPPYHNCREICDVPGAIPPDLSDFGYSRRSDIREVLRFYEPDTDACGLLLREIPDTPDSVQIVASWSIDATGAAQDPEVLRADPDGLTEVESCLLAVLNDLSFPQPDETWLTLRETFHLNLDQATHTETSEAGNDEVERLVLAAEMEYSRGEYRQAMSLLNEALALDDEHSDIHWWLFRIHRRLDNDRASERAAHRYLVVDPDGPHANFLREALER